jgi:hypothetical protein
MYLGKDISIMTQKKCGHSRKLLRYQTSQIVVYTSLLRYYLSEMENNNMETAQNIFGAM